MGIKRILKKMSRRPLIFSILSSLWVVPTFGGGAGTMGLAFLKIGIGARAIGMGEAYTAVAEDATATYWNPAGLGFLPRGELSFTHNHWLQDISNEFLGIAVVRENYAFGLSFILTNIGGIERRVKPTVEPLGIFQAHDVALGFSCARKFTKNLSGGLTLKYLYEKIYIESARGLAIDFGMIFKTNIAGLQFGFSGQNYGKMSKLKAEGIALPQILRIGGAYYIPKEILRGSVLLASDFVHLVRGSSHMNFGLEYNYKGTLGLRLGFQSNYEEKDFVWGIGLIMKRYRFDYGIVPYSSGLGNTHRISLAIGF